MKNDIKILEKKYWEAMAAHDFNTVKSLTKFPCIVASKRGVMRVDEASYRRMFEEGAERKTSIKNISGEVVEMGSDHAMIAYLIELEFNGQAMKCACSSTWIKEDDKWLCAMHTESDLESGK